MIEEPEARLPADPTGIEEPHDVLAAEEFAMPAPGAAAPAQGRAPMEPRAYVPLALVALLALLLLRRRR